MSAGFKKTLWQFKSYSMANKILIDIQYYLQKLKELTANVYYLNFTINVNILGIRIGIYLCIVFWGGFKL